MVVDGEETDGFDGVKDLAFSPNSQRVAFGAMSSGKWQSVIDGVRGIPIHGLEGFWFSPDSEHIAYGSMIGKKFCVAVDDRLGKTYDVILLQGGGFGGRVVFDSAKPDCARYMAWSTNRIVLVEQQITGQSEIAIASDS